MPFDIENNTRTKNRNNRCVVSSLIITGILIVSGVTMGVLYATGVIWKNDKSSDTPQPPMPTPQPPTPGDDCDFSSYYENVHESDNVVLKNIDETYVFQTDVPFETNNMTVIWYDEFDCDTLDPTKWNSIIPYGWYSAKKQQQIYTNDFANLNVENGTLNIITTYQNETYSSAWIDTQNKFGFFPGMVIQEEVVDTIYIEASIMIDHIGQGFWPAFWLSPTNHTRYGNSPGSGEFDIMETINDMNIMYQVLHYGGDTPETNGKEWDKIESPTDTWAGEYHTYSVTWSLYEITFSIDNIDTFSVYPRSAENPDGWFTAASDNPSAPFDAPFYIIFNFAIGGTWPKNADSTTEFPNGMHVDYIRVFSV